MQHQSQSSTYISLKAVKTEMNQKSETIFFSAFYLEVLTFVVVF